MSNNNQINNFPDDSDPAGQAEYLAQVARNSQNNRLGYYGVPLPPSKIMVFGPEFWLFHS
jgi:hypothetical protein